jgi:hypothetical protein
MLDHCVLCCSQDHFRTRTRDLDHSAICRCRKHWQLARQERGFATCFPLDVSMVHFT